MLQYILLLLVYGVTIWLILTLGYGGIANLVEFKEQKIRINPLSKILFEISVFIFLDHLSSIFLFRNSLYASSFVLYSSIAIFLSILLGSFYLLRNKMKCLSLYFISFFLISFWVYSNTTFSINNYDVVFTWPKIFTLVFRYSPIVTLHSFYVGFLEAISSPVLYITLLGFIFISTVNTSELIRSFSELRIPLSITLIFAVFIKIIPQSLKHMDMSYKLQLIRGLAYKKPFFLRPFYYIYGYLIVILPAFVYIIKGSRNIAIALDTRGFRAYNRRTSLVKIGVNKIDLLLIFLSFFIIFVSY
ncbi:hypothetical protein DFR86_07980 [Acidianus sulfidivorans JP7]|uniref:Energy-coupling factor transporter transmembrane protein EcfT n=1 Tax=Acidianus sulfidivorans JP7 TaxID=619593 RepID=A0A2U9IN89_9CREN|nr:energy-coupling factor transporter transmembrane component T [Acidianus sulfidivorans]AWR97493.1 hypothetical protein DFR86_07980 [Acidianus sulfidivorans JP7]